jgi:NADH:ubiquinone oxidoreductase subunit 6 (subunit J)
VIKRGPRPVRHDPGASRDGGGMDARTVALAALAGLLLVSGLFVLLARRFRPATLGLAGTFLATAGVLVLEGAPLAAIPVALSAVPALLSLRRLRGSGPRGLRVRVAGVLVAGVFLAALLLALAGVSPGRCGPPSPRRRSAGSRCCWGWRGGSSARSSSAWR